MELTQSVLKKLLEYDPSSGEFRWKVDVNSGNRGRAGTVAGSYDRHIGYIRITIDSTRYYAHRLAFLYMTGSFPDKIVDHINRERSDNRWENLRPATHSENALNR